MEKIYLDNGSTSFPKAPGLSDAMANFINNEGYNVGRGGYKASYDVNAKVLETRELFASVFGLDKTKNVVFTPGITFSINYLLQGLLKPGDHVIISAMEHNAVARPCHYLKDTGVEVTTASCDKSGNLDIENFKNSFKLNTKLVLMIHASNVSGTILDAKKVGQICKEKGVMFALDAAQTAGIIPIDFSDLNLSALCLAGHKGLLGPQGIGVLLIKDHVAEMITPTIYGGTGSISHRLDMPKFMPDHIEAGTMNLPGIIGLLHSFKYVINMGMRTLYETETELANYFIENISQINGIKITGPKDKAHRVGIISVDVSDTLDNAELAYKLDSEYGIMTRCGLHCAPLAHKTLGTYPQGTVRFSLGHTNTKNDINNAIEAINRIVKETK